MNIGIFTYGTRGDLQPYVALALGLMDKGHKVTLSATEDFKEFVEGFGIFSITLGKCRNDDELNRRTKHFTNRKRYKVDEVLFQSATRQQRTIEKKLLRSYFKS